MKILKEVSKKEFKDFLYNIDDTDENLYKEVNDINKIGVFQLTAGTASKMVKDINPQNFDEMNACSAFARPGTMDFVDQYISNRDSKTSPYPDSVSELLKETNSICLYQEQTMSIFNKIGGFSLEECNNIRGLMKKLSKADKQEEDLKEWNKIISKFKRNAEKQGLSKTDADNVANDLLNMSSYQFNKSHSVAYSYVSLMNLYLSVYFREYFYSSVLAYEADKGDYLLDRLNSVKRKGFKILPPDINLSKEHLSPVNKKTLIFGLGDVKYVGEKPSQIICEYAPYKDFIDFYLKISGNRINIRAISSLIKIGAFDSLYPNRKKLLATVHNFWEIKKSTKLEDKLRILWDKAEKNINNLPGFELTNDDLRQYEFECLGFNYFFTPFTDDFLNKIFEMEKKSMLKSDIMKVIKVGYKVPVVVNKIKSFNDKNGNEMAFVEIEDYLGEVRSIPIFQSMWKFVKEYLVEGKVHLINLFLKDGQVMFGENGFINDEDKIIKFVKRLDNL